MGGSMGLLLAGRTAWAAQEATRLDRAARAALRGMRGHGAQPEGDNTLLQLGVCEGRCVRALAFAWQGSRRGRAPPWAGLPRRGSWVCVVVARPRPCPEGPAHTDGWCVCVCVPGVCAARK